METRQLLKVNPAFCQMLGYSEAELLQLTLPDIHPPEEWPRLMKDLEGLVYGISVLIKDRPFKCKDGSIFYTDINATSIDLENRRCALGVCRDITERKQAQDELRESEARFRRYFEMPLIGIAITSPTKGWLEVNDRLCEILGYSRSELLRMTWAELTHSEDLAADIAQFDQLLAGKIESYQLEKRFIRKDGRSVPTELAVSSARAETGALDYVVELVQDISQRKEAEEMLRDSEAKFRIVANNTYDWELWTSPENQVLYTSPSCLRITGHTAQEFRDDPELLYKIIHPDDQPAFREHHRLVAHSKISGEAEFRIIRPDGAERWIAHVCQLVLSQEGRYLGVRSSNRDSTERKQEEIILRQLVAIIESSDDAIIGKNLDSIITIWNNGAQKIFGYEAEEMIGTSIMRLIPADRQYEETQILEKIRRGESVEHFETVRQTKDGRLIDVSITASPIKNATGQIVGVSKIVRDITERKQALWALRSSEARFKTIFNEAPLGIALIDSLTGHIYSVNPMFAKIAGRTVEEMEQIDWISITHPDDVQEDLDNMALLNAGKIAGFHMEKRYLHPDGTPVWINMTITPIYVEDKAHPRHLCMIEDITERKREQERLKAVMISVERAKEAAEAANRAKDEFIAMLSHELRTPLTPVLSTVSALQEQEEMPGPLRSDIELIRRNVEMEAALIDDLLDVTRISRGKIILKQETVDVHDCLGTALEICGTEITSKRLEIRSEFHAEQHHVWADPARLRQVFWNLLKNAVKFTLAGGRITLRTHNIGDRMQIEISDTGIGIDPEVLPRIFNLFEQGERSRSRRFGGLGLGLHIARTVVEMHQGRLTAFSEGRNKGATFTVELDTVPSQEKPSALPAPSVEPQERPLRILVVEDHLDTMQVLTKLLKKWGHTVTAAESVRTAIEMADGQEFDLIVSDLGLPDGSGLDVMRHVKERSAIPGIALSGYGTDEDIRQSRAAGFAEHLVKPVNIAALRTAIHRIAFDEGS